VGTNDKKYQRVTNISFDVDGDDTPTALDVARHNYSDLKREQRLQAGLSASKGLCFMSLGSGSSGNCAYLGTPTGGILIDAGVDHELVMDTLARNGILPQHIKGIILTHDHQDHVRYAYRIVRSNRHIRLYCTPKLMNGMLRKHNVSSRIKDYQERIWPEIPFRIMDFEITAFTTSHDGSDNMGFMIEWEGERFVVATDMGLITDRAAYYMAMANHLMIESNYDLTMLNTGRYPEMLKDRVRGPQGHLDNAVAAQFVASHYHEGLKHVLLCHLSNDNNRPEVACAAMRQALEARGVTVGDGSNAVGQRECDVQVYALPRFDPSPWFVLA